MYMTQRMTHKPSFLLLGLLAISALNPGCDKKDDTKVYSLAKETPSSPVAAPSNGSAPEAMPPGHPGMTGATPAGMPAGHPSMGGEAPAAMPPGHPSIGGMADGGVSTQKPELDINIGTPPPQWKPKAPSAMRVASFEVNGENGAVADVSLILLGAEAGGILDNVNRWQAQLGQPGLTSGDLAQKTQRIDSPLGEMTVVDIQGLPQGADATKDGRILAAMVPNGGMIIFLKMRGNAELVGAQKDAFLKWVKTVHIGTGQPEASAQPTAAASSPSVVPGTPADGSSLPPK